MQTKKNKNNTIYMKLKKNIFYSEFIAKTKHLTETNCRQTRNKAAKSPN